MKITYRIRPWNDRYAAEASCDGGRLWRYVGYYDTQDAARQACKSDYAWQDVAEADAGRPAPECEIIESRATPTQPRRTMMNAETITVTDCEGHTHQAQLIAGSWEDGCATVEGRAVQIWKGEVDLSCRCAIGSIWEGFDDKYEVVQNGDETTWKEITE